MASWLLVQGTYSEYAYYSYKVGPRSEIDSWVNIPPMTSHDYVLWIMVDIVICFTQGHSHGVYKPTDWRDDLWTTHVDYPAW